MLYLVIVPREEVWYWLRIICYILLIPRAFGPRSGLLLLVYYYGPSGLRPSVWSLGPSLPIILLPAPPTLPRSRNPCQRLAKARNWPKMSLFFWPFLLRFPPYFGQTLAQKMGLFLTSFFFTVSDPIFDQNPENHEKWSKFVKIG